MGNVQTLNHFSASNPSHPIQSLSNLDDTHTVGLIPDSTNFDNKLICEYCQEYCYPHFHQQHTRICPCNPANIRPNQGPSSARTHSSSHTELQKLPCKYCEDLCFVKYKENHERICTKNPENIRVTCRSCNKTFNLITYQNHLDSCDLDSSEESGHQRRRSVNSTERTPRTLHAAGLRRSKTNIDIKYKNNERSNSVKLAKQEDLECPICLEEISSRFELTSLMCKHQFHRHCIQNWSCVQRRCPICRKDFI